MPTSLPDITDIVRRALAEDIGTGDITTLVTVPPEAGAQATLIAKAEGVIAGLPVAMQVFTERVNARLPLDKPDPAHLARV